MTDSIAESEDCELFWVSIFQCSPQSEAEGIERSFESARKFISDETNTQNRRFVI